ncbi:hypothetical protein RB653_009858 [Dictyostelium firmibasis]|uniref:Uncharacterized protein n=1 Tax=Dictyostelium firmibasis TaxID=79012 RepID=A0AAN7TY92_9MYCE
MNNEIHIILFVFNISIYILSRRKRHEKQIHFGCNDICRFKGENNIQTYKHEPFKKYRCKTETNNGRCVHSHTYLFDFKNTNIPFTTEY